MGRIAKQPAPKWEGKHWRLRFTFEGVRHDYRTTAVPKTDTRTATLWAQERIQFVVSGKWKETLVEGADPHARLLDVGELYLREAGGGAITARTARLYRLQLTTHLAPYFETLSGVTAASIASYQAERLKVVQFQTIKKELSVLRRVLNFAELHAWIREIPKFPRAPAKSLGTKHASAPSGPTDGFTEVEAAAVIRHLPEMSKARRFTGERWPLRAFFEMLLETGLRPGTIEGIRVGKHWVPGTSVLNITPDIDKNRWGRAVPLTERAVEILTTTAKRADGSLFKHLDFKEALVRAAKAAGLPEKAQRSIHAYDFRHARGTQMVNTGMLLGSSFMLGHKQMTTTNRYSHANQRQAETLVSTLAAPGSGAHSGVNSGADMKKAPGGLCDPLPEALHFGCAKERTRTSTRVTPLAPQPTKKDLETAFSRRKWLTEAHQSAPKRKNNGDSPHYFSDLPPLSLPRELLVIAGAKFGLLRSPCGVLQ